MKPWREIAIPRSDVLEGTFQQSAFAVDITAVQHGEASREYQQADAFFERTYITEGMRLLLTQVARRLNGTGGEPVIQLQTAFGGGKTHTMLAVYHLATRNGSLNDLVGIPSILDQAGLLDVPRSRVAIIDGNALPPAASWKHDKISVHTLWGELAWQLGGAEGYESVRAADESGTSPGKNILCELLSRYAPCVVLVDELVAYVRQFPDGQKLSGGTYDSNLSFIQALTEAVKFVPNAVLLATLPESEVEAGRTGATALRALEKTFGRVQAIWKPVDTEESFEIVRRRLFEPIRDESARDTICRAFADLYLQEKTKLPWETQEARYFDRLVKAYPIHPEVFDRLYEDWSALESFQRTRGVLKLMANVIHELWVKGNQDTFILPSSLPLYRGKSRNELISHLPPGWDSVLDRDVDDDHAESADIDNRDTRFGQFQAARRVARTTFFGSAPSSLGSKNLNRGIDRSRIILGCLQPEQSSSLFSDALNRLTDRLHYLNASGDKTQDSTRFWFDTRANLRREMEDRKRRFDEGNELREKIAATLSKLTASQRFFDGVHVFTQHADIPDDEQLRLVILPIDHPYAKQEDAKQEDAKQEEQPVIDKVKEYIRLNGTRPRSKTNRLVFLAPDASSMSRLKDAIRASLAWNSIVKDITDGRLNVDRLQETQAKKELETAEAVVVRATRDCYRWILCPVMRTHNDRDIKIESFSLNTSSTSLTEDILRVCEENELIIATWSPVHLKNQLRELYWKDNTIVAKAMTVWEDMQKYLYLPRLKNREVYQKALAAGAAGTDFFGIAYNQDGDKFEGFCLGTPHVQLDGTLLLIEPAAAQAYQAAQKTIPDKQTTLASLAGLSEPREKPTSSTSSISGVVEPKPTEFFGSVEVNASTAKMKFVTLADEIINVLTSDPNGSVRITVEIHGNFPKGVPDHIKRAVNENATQIGFKSKNWE